MRFRAFLLFAFAAIAAGLSPRFVGAADMGKTLRVAFPVAETGFDPQAVGDAYSFYVCNAIFDPLYTYDYFARPVRLVPNTAAGLPQITDGGRTYTIKVRPGIYFASDPAFKGKRRELTAEDYVYSIKRIFDPKVRSYWLYLFENNLLGLEPVLAAARSSGTLDYEARIEGLVALDRYTLRIRFRNPDYVFGWWLTFDGFAAVAREVVDAYQDGSNRVMDHPVGTGPYRIKEWTRGQKIVLEANPDFRDETYPSPGPGSESGNVVANGALKPEYAKRGVRLHRQIEPSLQFMFFNLDDPVVGGYTPEKIALRRAIAMGYDRDADIRLLNNGQAEPANQLVPPGLAGHDPALPGKGLYDPGAARALLDRFGYRDREGDGYRETPDGKPLTLVKASTPVAADRDRDELWKRSMDAIGLKITFLKNKWPELNKMSEAGQLMMWDLGWIASVPDGDPFVSPLYSKNIGTANDARFRLPEFDRLYEESRQLPNGAARDAAFRKMNDLVRNYAPWLLIEYRYFNVLAQPWLKGYKQNIFLRNQWKYYDVAAH